MFHACRSILALGLFLLTILSPGHVAAAPELVFDAETGAVLFDRDATQPWHPASLTKLMTVYVAYAAIADGTISPESPVAISAHAASAAPSRMDFPVGTRLTLETALKILVVKSANDIAVAIAEAVAGTEAKFVVQMNSASRLLGMSDTVWANPHGLSDTSQVTTAQDLAILVRALKSQFPQSSAIFTLHGFTIDAKTVVTHNGLAGRIPGSDGYKTGYICSSGFNTVASATRDGRQIVAIVFGFADDLERDAHAAHLIESGFATPSGPKSIDDLARLSGATAPDLRQQICGGRKDLAAGDIEPGLRKAKERWAAAFKKMPRDLDDPVELVLLPPAPVAPTPAPRGNLDAIRAQWAGEHDPPTSAAEQPQKTIRRF